MSYQPCSVIAATRMMEIVPDTFLYNKQKLLKFVNKTCLYQSPEATRTDYNWKKLRKVLERNFAPELVGEELNKKLYDIFRQDKENDK